MHSLSTNAMSHFTHNPLLVSILFILPWISSCTKDPVDQPEGNGDPVDTLPEYSILPHTDWEQYANNPVLQPTENEGDWDENMTSAPFVILLRDTLRMWYEGSTSVKLDGVIQIGYAWSLDGIEWNRLDAPVLEAIPDSWAYPHMASPVVLEDGDTLRMWFGGGDYTSVGMVIGYAASLDGIHWTRHDAPVISRTKDWNTGGVLPGPVMKEDGVYKMWFTGGTGHVGYPNSSTSWSTGYATSEDGVQWTVNDEPVLEHGMNAEFDENSALAGSVIRSDTLYEMWYSGFRGIGQGSSIGVAVSEDGIKWEKYEGNPVMNKSLISDALYNPRVIIFEGGYQMWYSAWHPGPTIHHAIAIN